MEKRIKILYIITILAILAFLAMQAYWLYGRYHFSLKEHERILSEKIIECVQEYNAIRERASEKNDYHNKKNKDNTFTIPSFSLRQHFDDTVKTIRTAKLFTYMFSAHELLGIKPGTTLSEEQKKKALDLAMQQMIEPIDSVIFDASGAKDENEAWSATRSIHTERKCPFTAEGIDSILGNAGIKAETCIAKADSMVWNVTVDYNTSLFSPKVSLTIPYSQLEGQTVSIVSAINPIDLLPAMWQTLIATIAISALLIICLIWQFTTLLKLSRLDKMRNSFITTMIHELKRPVSTLKMCVSGIENERMMADKTTKKELVTEIRMALNNLSAYFSKLRDITFNDVEQIPLTLQNIPLHDLFDNVIAATAIPSGKEVSIRNDIGTEVIVPADPSHLFNILNNIVENAVKYSCDSVEITASATEAHGTVKIRIADNGNGISSGDLNHIFKRFYRGKTKSGDVPGMGLGLAYVKLLVEAHGGEITVESRENEGTCFTITLPQ